MNRNTFRYEHIPLCYRCGKEMEPVSRGIFKCERGTSKRVVYEVMFWCPDEICKGTDMVEWRIKPSNTDLWDKFFFSKEE